MSAAEIASMALPRTLMTFAECEIVHAVSPMDIADIPYFGVAHVTNVASFPEKHICCGLGPFFKIPESATSLIDSIYTVDENFAVHFTGGKWTTDLTENTLLTIKQDRITATRALFKKMPSYYHSFLHDIRKHLYVVVKRYDVFQKNALCIDYSHFDNNISTVLWKVLTCYAASSSTDPRKICQQFPSLPRVPFDYNGTTNAAVAGLYDKVNDDNRLMNWQKAIVRWMIDQERAFDEVTIGFTETCRTAYRYRILAARPGLGKTRLVASLLQTDTADDPDGLTVVVVPRILYDQWKQQICDFDPCLRDRLVLVDDMTLQKSSNYRPLPKGILLIGMTAGGIINKAGKQLISRLCAKISRTVVDEYHQCNADLFLGVFNVLMKPKGVIWLVSGTPKAFNFMNFLPDYQAGKDLIFQTLMRKIGVREDNSNIPVELHASGLCIPKTRHVLVHVKPSVMESVAYRTALTIVMAACDKYPLRHYDVLKSESVTSVNKAWSENFEVTSVASPYADAIMQGIFTVLIEPQWTGPPVPETSLSLLKEIETSVRENTKVAFNQYPCCTKRFRAAKWLFQIANNLGYFRGIDQLANCQEVVSKLSMFHPSDVTSVLHSLTSADAQNTFLRNVLDKMKNLASTRFGGTSSSSSSSMCPICLDDVDEMNFVQISPCGHKVCEQCIAAVQVGRPCPECRSPIHAYARVKDIAEKLTTTAVAEPLNIVAPEAMSYANNSKIQALLSHIVRTVVERKHAIVFAEDKAIGEMIHLALTRSNELQQHHHSLALLFGRNRLKTLANFRKIVENETFGHGVGILITNEMAGIDLPQIRNIFIVQPSIKWISAPEDAVNDEIQLLSRCRRINTNNEECTVTRFVMQDTIEELLVACYWSFTELDLKTK
jgi:hypothetical protein